MSVTLPDPAARLLDLPPPPLGPPPEPVEPPVSQDVTTDRRTRS